MNMGDARYDGIERVPARVSTATRLLTGTGHILQYAETRELQLDDSR